MVAIPPAAEAKKVFTTTEPISSQFPTAPKEEPGFHVQREEVKGRSMRYSIKSYATDKPEGRRY